jgi:hypothetical protein
LCKSTFPVWVATGTQMPTTGRTIKRWKLVFGSYKTIIQTVHVHFSFDSADGCVCFRILIRPTEQEAILWPIFQHMPHQMVLMEQAPAFFRRITKTLLHHPPAALQSPWYPASLDLLSVVLCPIPFQISSGDPSCSRAFIRDQ